MKLGAATSERSGGGRAVRSVVYKAEARADVARFGQRTTSSPRLRIPHRRALAALAPADGRPETARAYLGEAVALAEWLGLPGETRTAVAALATLDRPDLLQTLV